MIKYISDTTEHDLIRRHQARDSSFDVADYALKAAQREGREEGSVIEAGI